MSAQAEDTVFGLASLNDESLLYCTALRLVKRSAPDIATRILDELRDQKENLKLIASENFCSVAVQAAMANLLTDKYAEGYPYHRFYAGCDNVDAIEDTARKEACKLFGSEHAYVQPHSGADANLVAFWAILRTRVQEPRVAALEKRTPLDLTSEEWAALRRDLGNQRLLGMDLYAGGHLTHGYRLNVSAQLFDVHQYGVDPTTGLLDYDDIHEKLQRVRPLIFLVGYSAYPRHIDFQRMRQMADEVGAVMLVDMSHFAGLVAGGAFTGVNNPVPYAHVLTSTTHKTLRGPRGGVVLSTAEFAESLDKGCPMVLGGPLPHVLAAKAVAFLEAGRPAFRQYAANIVANARALASACQERGLKVVTGGTDNHLLLLDVRPHGLTGRQAETALRECRITLNRNTIPGDTNGPWYTSGLRVGTPAVTTQGMGVAEMDSIADIIKCVLSGTTAAGSSKAKYRTEDSVRQSAMERVTALLREKPVYPEIDYEKVRGIVGA
jgi:glycine hydroxymethyltransferase